MNFPSASRDGSIFPDRSRIQPWLERANRAGNRIELAYQFNGRRANDSFRDSSATRGETVVASLLAAKSPAAFRSEWNFASDVNVTRDVKRHFDPSISRDGKGANDVGPLARASRAIRAYVNASGRISRKSRVNDSVRTARMCNERIELAIDRGRRCAASRVEKEKKKKKGKGKEKKRKPIGTNEIFIGWRDRYPT